MGDALGCTVVQKLSSKELENLNLEAEDQKEDDQ